jgi:hypothetical protein
VKLGGHLIMVGDFAKYKPDGSLRKKIPFGQISEVLGEGRITYLSDDQCYDKYHWAILIHRFSSDLEKEFKDAPEYSVEKLRNTGGKALLDAIAYDTIVRVESSQDLYHSLFKVKKGYALHLVNVEDTISKEGKVNHMLPIPNFTEGAKPIRHEIEVSIKMDTPIKKVTLYSPERKRALNIPFKESSRSSDDNGSTGNTLFFVIPKKVFAGYALVEIK